MMHGGEKSDPAVVAGKSPNRAGQPAAEAMEPRAHISAKSNGGRFLLKRQTMRKRMRAKRAEIKEEMRHRLHQRIAAQGQSPHRDNG